MNKHIVNILMAALSWTMFAGASTDPPVHAQDQQHTAATEDNDAKTVGNRHGRRRLFERETFGGNGRTCVTCHGRETGTVYPEEAQNRFYTNPADSLFVHDGSDDGLGHGAERILSCGARPHSVYDSVALGGPGRS